MYSHPLEDDSGLSTIALCGLIMENYHPLPHLPPILANSLGGTKFSQIGGNLGKEVFPDVSVDHYAELHSLCLALRSRNAVNIGGDVSRMVADVRHFTQTGKLRRTTWPQDGVNIKKSAIKKSKDYTNNTMGYVAPDVLETGRVENGSGSDVEMLYTGWVLEFRDAVHDGLWSWVEPAPGVSSKVQIVLAGFGSVQVRGIFARTLNANATFGSGLYRMPNLNPRSGSVRRSNPFEPERDSAFSGRKKLSERTFVEYCGVLETSPKSLYKRPLRFRVRFRFSFFLRDVNAEPEPRVRFNHWPNVEPERGVQSGSVQACMRDLKAVEVNPYLVNTYTYTMSNMDESEEERLALEHRESSSELESDLDEIPIAKD
ncbi:hypothetical protein B0H16DRAFT_1482108 [Mycena metata]|uniref:Uncharacterized protein n=1 Tax=Mycena metata TaxID=1033252 RepID=A0AAD7M8M2_9AGAR|nr:hypothetical protein B0H16DRAFT_1482108 [Mycena metata]